jgi:penicillin-binding protein 1A
VLFVAALASVVLLSGFAYLLASVPLPAEDPLRQTTFICSAAVDAGCGPDNAMAALSAEEDRVNVRLDEVPDVLVDAVLAAEDRDFFDHAGLDPVGIGRALLSDLRNQEAKQGGSTITQQYVKTVYLSSERTVSRKLKEAVLAIKLERELEKEEILERYLNAVYFGRGAYGVQAASRAYFGKDVGDVALHEAAFLASLIRSPESADPSRDVEEAQRRRATVLTAMLEEGWIDQSAHDAANEVPWVANDTFRARTAKQGLGTVEGAEHGTEYFVEYVRRQLAEKYGEDVVYGGGLRVYTTLDLGMQEAAFDAVTETLNQPGDPAAALVAVDEAGLVRAMMGGRDFGSGEGESEVNYALGQRAGGSGRQPGSAFKPFVLAEAVKQGISVRSVFNAPARMVFPNADVDGDWTVRNYANTPQGKLDLIGATRASSNTVYAQLMLEVGPENVVRLANEMGIEHELPAVNSLVLGTGETSPYDMAAAYSTLARRGVRITPTVVTKVEQVQPDGDVTVLEQWAPDPQQVLSQQEADIVTHCLEQVVEEGTGKAAAFGRDAAGKTGTTQSNRDAWFVGYTPKLTAAVWMGYPGKPGELTPEMNSVHGREVTGGSFPAEIWRRFMGDALVDEPSGVFPTITKFPGTIVNPRLGLSSGDPDEDDSTSTSSSSSSSTSSTAPDPTTTTTAPPTTTTTKPPPSTTTTRPPPPTTTTLAPN